MAGRGRGVEIKAGESFESALRRLKRVVEKSGIIGELNSRKHHVSDSELKKRAKAAAKKRLKKKQKETRCRFDVNVSK